MTRNELAKVLKVTPKTVFEWQKKAGFPKEKKQISPLKWRWDFNIEAVREWLKENNNNH